jgi:hypothetical protein
MEILLAIALILGFVLLSGASVLVATILLRTAKQTLTEADEPARRRGILAGAAVAGSGLVIALAAIVLEITQPFGEHSGVIPIFGWMALSVLALFLVGTGTALHSILRSRRRDS